MSAFDPTPEQEAASAAFATGENVLLRAGAGTGKTSTLRLLAERFPDRRILFIAFNVSVKEDAAKSFPSNVTCLTSAGLANRGLRRSPHADLLRKIGGPRQSPVDISKILGLPFNGFQGEELSLKGYQVASSVMAAVRRFCYSDDTEIKTYHVPRIENANDGDMRAFRNYVLPYARKAWADLTSTTGRLSWGKSHDYYFKFWSLSNPALDFDAVMVDEAQDTNPALAAVIAQQTCQIVMVGDESQAIYGWRGAQDAMATFDAAHVVNLSQSFRFGPAVAEVANRFLDLLDAPLRITGAGPKSEVQEIDTFQADAILCRTNAAVIEYAMDAIAHGRSVAIVGGTTEIKSFVTAADKLMIGKATTHPELCAFKSWDEVLEYVQTDDGRDLRVMVKMVQDHGVQAILDICDDTTTEAKADVIVSTAHKAKGRQWGAVKIGGDFKVQTEEDQGISRAELMLMYVAVTRAQTALDPGILAQVQRERAA